MVPTTIFEGELFFPCFLSVFLNFGNHDQSSGRTAEQSGWWVWSERAILCTLLTPQKSGTESLHRGQKLLLLFFRFVYVQYLVATMLDTQQTHRSN